MSRVLVVEDDPLVRTAIARMVGALGHEVLVAEGVEAALERLERESIDLVLTDFRMPPSDGLTLAAEIRRSWPRVEIVLMSGDLDATLAERASDAGVLAALAKPFRLDTLRSVLEPAPRILIVEDDEAVADALLEVVERAGCDGVVARNGREALAYLGEQDRLPCAILLDLMMPVMDGWEFLRSRDARLRGVPVVVLSAARRPDGLPDDVATLTKPASMDVILGALRPHWESQSGT